MVFCKIKMMEGPGGAGQRTPVASNARQGRLAGGDRRALWASLNQPMGGLIAGAASALANGVAAAACTGLPVGPLSLLATGVTSRAVWQMSQAEQAGLLVCALQPSPEPVGQATAAALWIALSAVVGCASALWVLWALWLALASACAT